MGRDITRITATKHAAAAVRCGAGVPLTATTAAAAKSHGRGESIRTLVWRRRAGAGSRPGLQPGPLGGGGRVQDGGASHSYNLEPEQ